VYYLIWFFYSDQNIRHKVLVSSDHYISAIYKAWSFLQTIIAPYKLYNVTYSIQKVKKESREVTKKVFYGLTYHKAIESMIGYKKRGIRFSGKAGSKKPIILLYHKIKVENQLPSANNTVSKKANYKTLPVLDENHIIRMSQLANERSQ
jgi:hypothetical protein